MTDFPLSGDDIEVLLTMCESARDRVPADEGDLDDIASIEGRLRMLRF